MPLGVVQGGEGGVGGLLVLSEMLEAMVEWLGGEMARQGWVLEWWWRSGL